jgi:cation:H+ antiporter
MDPTLFIELTGGLVYLLLGGDVLVRGAVALARKYRVSPVVIALTVVAFGTSLPEMVVVVQAALTGYPGLVFGNVVGSNIANILLVAGGAAIVYPLTYGEHSVRRDSIVMIAATVFLILLSLNGTLGRVEGVILLVGLAGVTLITMREATRMYRGSEVRPPLEWALGLPANPWMIALFIVVGAIGLPLGAKLVVDASVGMATSLGVDEALIGLTILAFGTSLPELATTVMAAVQKRTEVAIGTVVGSNIFNILAILGVGAIVSPIPFHVSRDFFTLNFPVMLGTAILLSVFVWLRKPIGRPAGIVFVAWYVTYIALLVLRSRGLVG